jgi:hypothetical protein
MSTIATAAFHRAIEAWNTGDVKLVEEAFAPDSVYHVPPFPDLVGIEAQKQFISAFLAGFPDFHVTVDEDIIMDTTSAHRWHAEGTYSGQSPMLPGSPTGKHTQA